eukprot:jgi/Psemu1/298690/fgenesh1_pm.687_\
MSPSNIQRSQKPFPFTVIIVTNPDEGSARTAQNLLDSTLKLYLENTRRSVNSTQNEIKIVSTCDPFGARCGSFGGTLAALEFVDDKTNEDDEPETVLCLHAGGDSSRCPLSMILGKAWTNFPSSEYRNPIAWLLSQLEDLFYRARMPKGTLLVVATDCLILMGEPGDDDEDSTKEDSAFDNMDPYTVLGVAVPAALNKAKNHGVFIMPESSLPFRSTENEDGDHDLLASSPNSSFHVGTPTAVWQKPSVEKLLTNATTTTFTKDDVTLPPTCFDVPKRSGKQAWIDSGIVIFYPKAFETLMSLSKGLLAMCTRQGIKAAYQASLAADHEGTANSLESFARANALKVDLYTDILHNLPLTDKAKLFQANDSKDIKAVLREILSTMSLKVLVDSDGKFLHVGTTQELIELVTVGSNANRCTAPIEIPTVMDPTVTKSWGKGIGLTPRYQTWQLPLDKDGANLSNVTLCSTFPSNTDQIDFGAYSFVEYSDLKGYDSVSIGNHSMLSGCRGPPSGASGKSLRIPDAVSVQFLPTVSRADKNTGDDFDQVQGEWVMMVLGSADSIKSSIRDTNIYGIPFLDFVERTGISLDQIGFEDELKESDCLWTANIHPVMCATGNTEDFSSLFGWLDKLRSGEPDLGSDESLAKWLSAERVSLKTIHHLADASQERSYRIGLEDEISHLFRRSHIDKILTLIKERCHNVPCDLEWLMEIKGLEKAIAALCALVEGLEDLATEEFANGNFDTSGRALMLASVSIVEFVDEIMPQVDSVDEKLLNDASTRCEELIHMFRVSSSQSVSAGEKIMILKESFEFRRSLPNTRDSMSLCSKVLERLALCMNELTILAGFRTCLDPMNGNKISMNRTGATIQDKFVLSVAPVRVDLAGAWSDTPPVTYEHGGSVALLCLGMVSEEQILQSDDIQKLINQFCSSLENVRLEIISNSLLGLGTGMGTSSILGACVLQSLATCVGIGKLDYELLVHAVLLLEQLLSSGGGWQDQAHGIVGGVKTVVSSLKIPLQIKIAPIDVSHLDMPSFENRLMFAYTGTTRLAKNILQQVLRRWARRTNEVVNTVDKLVECSSAVRTAFENGSWDSLGEYMYQSHKLKCVMAGEHSGAEPECIKLFISELMARGKIKGAMLCGAGGGGFLMLLLSENVLKESIENIFEKSILPQHEDFKDFSFHDCRIAQSGLTSSIIEEEAIDANTYHLSWQSPTSTKSDPLNLSLPRALCS